MLDDIPSKAISQKTVKSKPSTVSRRGSRPGFVRTAPRIAPATTKRRHVRVYCKQFAGEVFGPIPGQYVGRTLAHGLVCLNNPVHVSNR